MVDLKETNTLPETPLQLLKSSGPWPFTTRRLFSDTDKTSYVWLSRMHRKRGGRCTILQKEDHVATTWLWRPDNINWWIGVAFAIGSFSFALASWLSLDLAMAKQLDLSLNEINLLFFAGTIPFTTGAYLQLFQAANTPSILANSSSGNSKRQLFGWRPKDIGWLGCALQFSGTVLFNINTLDVFIPGLNWWQQDFDIWMPNFFGSILFLAAGYLAYIETCHTYFAWRPHSLSWWVVSIGLLGCVGFMISAVFAIVLPKGSTDSWMNLSLIFTLQGAICFFIGALLLLPETLATLKSEISYE